MKLNEVLKAPMGSSGGAAETKKAPIKKKTMTFKELFDLLKKIPGAYYWKDIEKIHDGSDPDPDAKDWGVYQTVLKYVKYTKEHPDVKMPPIQITSNKFSDGNHRVATLLLLTKEDPKWWNKKVDVEWY